MGTDPLQAERAARLRESQRGYQFQNAFQIRTDLLVLLRMELLYVCLVDALPELSLFAVSPQGLRVLQAQGVHRHERGEIPVRKEACDGGAQPLQGGILLRGERQIPVGQFPDLPGQPVQRGLLRRLLGYGRRREEQGEEDAGSDRLQEEPEELVAIHSKSPRSTTGCTRRSLLIPFHTAATPGPVASISLRPRRWRRSRPRAQLAGLLPQPRPEGSPLPPPRRDRRQSFPRRR